MESQDPPSTVILSSDVFSTASSRPAVGRRLRRRLGGRTGPSAPLPHGPLRDPLGLGTSDMDSHEMRTVSAPIVVTVAVQTCEDCGAAEPRTSLSGVWLCDRCTDRRVEMITGYPEAPEAPPPLEIVTEDGRRHVLIFRIRRSPTGIEVELEEADAPPERDISLQSRVPMTPMSKNWSTPSEIGPRPRFPADTSNSTRTDQNG